MGEALGWIHGSFGRNAGMKILEVKALAIGEIKVVRYGRFPDHRGFFAEHFRKSDYETNPQLDFLKGVEFSQCNESCSKSGTVRGLHFQWNPYMGKLVRTLRGRMIDLALDIRKGSPTFGKILGYDMPADFGADFSEWIWIPPGFAHGNYFSEESHIEYFCSGEYSPGCEAGISPLAGDIDWSLCDPEIKKGFAAIVSASPLMTEKDRHGFTLSSWLDNPNSDRFIFKSEA
jgi:dTDP-4-dehydrorhamnose 3,5-epimerase